MSDLRGAAARVRPTRGLAEADLAADPVTMFRPLVRRRGRRRDCTSPTRWWSPRSSADGPPVVADGAAQGTRRARASCSSPTTPRARARDLAANPACSLLFPWHPLQRQVRVEGAREPAAREDEARRTSPPGRAASQLGAWASHQSARWSPARRARRRRTPTRRRGSPATTCRCRRLGRLRRAARDAWSSGRAGRGRMHDRLVYRRDGDAGARRAAGAVRAGCSRPGLDFETAGSVHSLRCGPSRGSSTFVSYAPSQAQTRKGLVSECSLTYAARVTPRATAMSADDRRKAIVAALVPLHRRARRRGQHPARSRRRPASRRAPSSGSSPTRRACCWRPPRRPSTRAGGRARLRRGDGRRRRPARRRSCVAADRVLRADAA